MKRILTILCIILCSSLINKALAQVPGKGLLQLRMDFFGDPFAFETDTTLIVPFSGELSQVNIAAFYDHLNHSNYQAIINALLDFKSAHQLDDWLYYQLIRQTAQLFSPKTENYERYTLYKWFLLAKSGYDAMLTVCEDQILFYVQCNENVYNIPYRMKDGRQYVCLNYHDYGSIDFSKSQFTTLDLPIAGASNSFTYRINKLPAFSDAAYKEKDLNFEYGSEHYDFKVKLNTQVQKIFTNYPVVDYSYYLNIPLSQTTYESLIPELRKKMQGMSIRDGVDYLMHFTRYAFLFKPDVAAFGQEKRMSPEETLLYSGSDCEDRVGLFFYLVKEIYDLPMIVLNYPKHVTIAVQLDKPVGNTIAYNGRQYSICEPTSQLKDLPVGKLPKQLRTVNYQVAYAYLPEKK